MKGYCENCKKVIDETEVYRFNKTIVCYGCFENLTMIDYFLKLDFLRVDYNLTRKESKPYLCQICRLCETCQNNFDYECVEASDFLFKPEPKVYTVKDDFLNSLINKDHLGLRDKSDDFDDNFSQAEADQRDMDEYYTNQ